MKSKYIFLSKLFFFTQENQLIENNLKLADYLKKENIIVYIVAKYETNEVLCELLPDDYVDIIKFVDRGKKTIDAIKSISKEQSICCMIGVVNADAIFSFHCKIPLFNPESMSKRLLSEDKIKKYGLPINSFKEVVACLKAYEIHQGNYFHIAFNQFSVISLNNANTYYRPEKEKEIKKIFETNLKGNNENRNRKILLLLLFHFINEVSTNPYFKDVKYWGTFPSSNPNNSNTSISFLKESLRNIVGGGPKKGPEILIRKKEMQPKHNTESNQRRNNKCDKDFDTLIVNPSVVKNLKGKVVCIIDDYITSGYSAEAARHLLLKAGVKKLIFLSFGKFGMTYTHTSYEIKGNVSVEYTYEFEKEHRFKDTYTDNNKNLRSFYDLNNDQEILGFDSLID